jgi:hypothetical protein
MSLGLGANPVAIDICIERLFYLGGYNTNESIYHAAYTMYNGLTQEQAFEQLFQPLEIYVNGLVLPSEKEEWTTVLNIFREVAWQVFPN